MDGPDDDSPVQLGGMQRFYGLRHRAETRYNPVLGRYQSDQTEKQYQQTQSRRRNRQLENQMRYPQAELQTQKDLHEGDAPPVRARRRVRPLDNDIFNPEPLVEQARGKRRPAGDPTSESADWWNLSRVDRAAPRETRISPYKAELERMKQKNAGTHMEAIMKPPPRREPMEDEPSDMWDPRTNKNTLRMLHHEVHQPSSEAVLVGTVPVSAIGQNDPRNARAVDDTGGKRVFSDGLHHRADYNIVTGAQYRDAPAPRFAKGMAMETRALRRGEGVAASIIHDPRRTDFDDREVGGRRRVARHMWAEAGGDDVWKPSQWTEQAV